MCCLLMYPECHCKCVAYHASCSASWGDKCKPPRVTDCERTAGQRICRCGGMNRRSCSQPSAPCDVKTTKLCCLVMYPECRCKCVRHLIRCSTTWGEQCRAPSVLNCDNDAGQRVCRCVQVPQLQALPPSTSFGGTTGTGNAQGTTARSCSSPSTPCDVTTSKLCCMIMYPQCQCKCVQHKISCSITWGEQCKPPRVIKCDENAGQRVCRCVQVPQLQALPPSTSFGGTTGTGNAQGGTSHRSCSLPSTPCDVKTTKLCCFVMYPNCQCKCVPHQISCSISWGDKCKAPNFMDCDKDAGQRVCRCVSAASKPSG
ncbi:uncharacterized protein LOC119458016 isoform X2 [Dermacentor silvarum]|uniref:uncharacterized protein LOC119458016 isoform X2 n=1 Tax=Dermacentor silvarum TaxID=543639 RepID=UPI00210094CA|nr:uncharacterized protein LOC119458016 isoform X2 [Dermacentor silvarum]